MDVVVPGTTNMLGDVTGRESIHRRMFRRSGGLPDGLVAEFSPSSHASSADGNGECSQCGAHRYLYLGI